MPGPNSCALGAPWKREPSPKASGVLGTLRWGVAVKMLVSWACGSESGRRQQAQVISWEGIERRRERWQGLGQAGAGRVGSGASGGQEQSHKATTGLGE